MHVMFIHPNFPAQFGFLAQYLKTQRNWQCTYVTSIDTSHLQLPFDHLNYGVYPGPIPKTYYNPNSLQGMLDHLAAVHKALKSAPQLQPDLVVGHMSYGTLLYLRTLYECPFIGYFEILPPPFWSDKLTLRKEFPATELIRLLTPTYHTLTYLHLHAVEAAYTPTHFQLNTAPPELRKKIRVIFDGVDCELFQRKPIPRPTEFRGIPIGPNTRVVTYVSRGLESARGFDIFMKTAKRIYEQYSDVIFLVAGQEGTFYGHEIFYIGNQTFKQYVLSLDTYDLSKFRFLGLIPLGELATLYSLSDLHIYLTTHYVLSWSFIQAMANECTLLASDTEPVREAVEDGKQALLVPFYDVDGLAKKALDVLRDPAAYRPMGAAARARVLERYELQKCADELASYFEQVVADYTAPSGSR